MNITLTPDIEQALTEEAQKQGTIPEFLALEYLRERLMSTEASQTVMVAEQTLADFLGDSIKVIYDSHRYRPARRFA